MYHNVKTGGNCLQVYCNGCRAQTVLFFPNPELSNDQAAQECYDMLKLVYAPYAEYFENKPTATTPFSHQPAPQPSLVHVAKGRHCFFRTFEESAWVDDNHPGHAVTAEPP